MNKTYSINELATASGLARSTIIDWLERYADYFHFEMKGKRKLYEENSLNVLQEIAQLREKSVPTHEIERILAKNHPLRPEITDIERPEGSALSVRSQQQGMANDIAHQFHMISENMSEIKDQYDNFFNKGVRQSLIYAVMALFSFCSLLGMFFLFQQYTMAENKNKVITQINTRNRLRSNELRRELEAREEKIASANKLLGLRSEQIRKLVVTLDKTKVTFRENVILLRKQIAEQQQAFQREIEKAKISGAKSQAMENAVLKNEFARKRLELLKKIELLGKKLSANEKLIYKLQQQNISQTETIKQLSKNSKEKTGSKK